MSVFPVWAWVGFTALIVVLLLDLLVLAHGEREISFRQAADLSVFRIVLALVFGVVVFAVAGPERGGEYLAGYVIEKSLSVDNVLVFALIFSYFAVPARYQYRVLFWGVGGALVLRAVFIALALFSSFQDIYSGCCTVAAHETGPLSLFAILSVVIVGLVTWAAVRYRSRVLGSLPLSEALSSEPLRFP